MRNLIQACVAGIAGAVTVVVLIGATSIKTDGSIETDQQLVSNVQRGTPPLAVQSSDTVSNLNADMLDGRDATAFALASNTYTMTEVDALLATYRDSRLAFYLTTTEFNGDEAEETGVCDTGFHFASLWEILDPSNLRYDTGRGYSVPDSGAGPPADPWGWIRTGRWSFSDQTNNNSKGDAGIVNCDAWSTASSGADGTAVALSNCWQEEADCGSYLGRTVAPWWKATEIKCDFPRPVWCVEDYPGAASG